MGENTAEARADFHTPRFKVETVIWQLRAVLCHRLFVFQHLRVLPISPVFANDGLTGLHAVSRFVSLATMIL